MIPPSGSRLSYKDRRSHQQKRFRVFGVVFLVVIVFELASILIAEPWILETESMRPGYPPGARILVSPYLPRDGSLRRPPQRGDLVSIRPPYVEEPPWYFKIFNPVVRLFTFRKVELGLVSDKEWQNSRVFKRIVGIPGDTIRLEESVAYVRGDGDEFFLSEFEMSGQGYDLLILDLPQEWSKAMPLSGWMEELKLGAGEYFVLGDNRSASNDSRYWGPIDEHAIRGRVFFAYWPLSLFGRTR